MPRKRKGVPPLSDRHIRRLSKKNTEHDLQIIESLSTKHSLLNSETNIAANSSCNVETIQQDLVSESTGTKKCKSSNVSIPANTSSADKTLKQDASCFESAGSQVNRTEGSYNLDFNPVSVHVDTNCSTSTYEFKSGYEDVINEYCVDANNSDTDSSFSSDIYRYSDNDAESIPDSDMDDSIDFDVMMHDSIADNDTKFHQEIICWARDYKIKHGHLKPLLAILNKYTGTKFPKDPRTLLKTPRSTDVIEMDSGQYCHLGVANAIEKIIHDRISQKHVFNTIKLSVNIDGAPLVGNSSEKGLWIISMKDVEVETVYAVGIYYGTSKPVDANVFLKRTKEEFTDLISNGFLYNGNVYNVRLDRLILDAPAKSFILCTKGHSGYYSCSKCTIEEVNYDSQIRYSHRYQ
ncbi:uncharacterized protein LOC131663322 isoform X2 [Phymastichus coffea]|uniref:uncharacterized protein LOC131663322 isoform X2 n=1 Tax=Phymastichus coffea TaxID=108790 RepID=UPI00273C1D87|nr:uncharacterized protein LOC131663322 isoform X2 [Phymastichus coffea]